MTYTLVKRAGAPAGALTISTSFGEHVIDDASNPTITTTSSAEARELDESPYLKIQSAVEGPAGPLTRAEKILALLTDPAAGDGIVRNSAGAWVNKPVAQYASAGTFTATQSFSPADPQASLAAVVNGRTQQDHTETGVANNRPVAISKRLFAAPGSVPGAAVDYHNLDVVADSSSSLDLANVGLYPMETNARFSGSGGMGRLVSNYALTEIAGTGVVHGDATALQVMARLTAAGSTPLLRGIRLRTPTNAGGTVTNFYGLHIEAAEGVAGIGSLYQLFLEGVLSRSFIEGTLQIGGPKPPAAPIGSLDLRARGSNTPNLVMKSIASYTGDHVQIRDASDNALTRFLSNGSLNIDKYGAAVLQTGAAIALRNTAGGAALVIKTAPTPTANILEISNDANAILATVSENGYWTTRKTSAPADAELVAGEAAFWLDATNGAAKFMVKAKQADGTVRTGSVALA